jgi:hypothetical protein
MFQSAFSFITATAPSRHSTANASYHNLESAMQRLSLVFSTISPYCSRRYEASEEDIRDTVQLARDIAIQFGVHPAQLRVVMPPHGEQVRIGDQFHDAYDGASNRGALCTVDLVKSAGLQKVGNGRGESQALSTIVPCEIFTEMS